MKEYVLKKNSWHYWIANYNGEARYSTDICDYIRYFIGGVLAYSLLAVIGIVVTAVLLYGAGNVFGWLFLDYQFESPAVVFLGVVAAAIIIFSIEKYREYSYNKPRVVKEPGFVGLAYDKFKNNSCARIRFED